jgi:hypothetical protein
MGVYGLMTGLPLSSSKAWGSEALVKRAEAAFPPAIDSESGKEKV